MTLTNLRSLEYKTLPNLRSEKITDTNLRLDQLCDKHNSKVICLTRIQVQNIMTNVNVFKNRELSLELIATYVRGNKYIKHSLFDTQGIFFGERSIVCVPRQQVNQIKQTRDLLIVCQVGQLINNNYTVDFVDIDLALP